MDTHWAPTPRQARSQCWGAISARAGSGPFGADILAEETDNIQAAQDIHYGQKV